MFNVAVICRFPRNVDDVSTPLAGMPGEGLLLPRVLTLDGEKPWQIVLGLFTFLSK